MSLQTERCPCGYSFRHNAVEYEQGEEIKLMDIGDEPFETVRITAFVDGDYHGPVEVHISMCPKCGTLQGHK